VENLPLIGYHPGTFKGQSGMLLAQNSLRKEILVSNIPFSISEKNVLRELRIPILKSLKELPEKHLAQYIKKAIDTAYTLIEGKAIYRTFEVRKVEDERVILSESENLFKGKNMAKLLRPCPYVTLMACTIGAGLEDRVDELKSDHPSDAYYLEIVGGWMADYMAEQVDKRIEQEITKNACGRTMRYSPGYGDWDLTCQEEMIRLTQAKRIGIRLTESCIMLPRKSVTAAIGWEKP
jgi:cobalamin-dependent methionine synthase I